MTEAKLEDAQKTLKAGLAKLPDNFALHEKLASVLEQKGDINAAMTEYEYLLKQQPGSLVLANNLASLLSDYRSDKESLDRAYSLAAVLKKSPVPSFQDTLGWVTLLRGDKAEAVKLLEGAAKGLPGRAVVQFHLGMAYEASGQGDKARQQFEKALSLNPSQDLAAKIKRAGEKLGMN
jgi:Tfp pilus assembly protein PilF